MTAPLLKPKFPPYITPSELAIMLNQAGGSGSGWDRDTVLSVLKSANALVDMPTTSLRIARRGDRPRKSANGRRYATTYALLQERLPDIHHALVVAAPATDVDRLLGEMDGAA